MIGLLNKKEEVLRQCTARLINTLASFTTGRLMSFQFMLVDPEK